jgi:hypothetical protein
VQIVAANVALASKACQCVLLLVGFELVAGTVGDVIGQSRPASVGSRYSPSGAVPSILRLGLSLDLYRVGNRYQRYAVS